MVNCTSTQELSNLRHRSNRLSRHKDLNAADRELSCLRAKSLIKRLVGFNSVHQRERRPKKQNATPLKKRIIPEFQTFRQNFLLIYVRN